MTELVKDAMAVAGVVLITAGCWVIYWPIALIAFGMILFGVSVVSAWRG